MASKLPSLRRLATLLQSRFRFPYPSSSLSVADASGAPLLEASRHHHVYSNTRPLLFPRSFCTDSYGPAAIDYHSLLQEDEYHKLANSTIHDLQEKLEEYGDIVQIDGFDVDYGNEVLTVKLGDLGTYVLNKQTPNRQLWLSSPVSGPSRFDWDQNAQAWVYRRTKANLLKLLESEVQQLCGEPITLT